ncbi:MAG TPA: FAD-dependent thymidylate synthase [Geobacterales bacterium]|nr:FAD-dependent thymidylate synthase [Geobacterales bacterium]
MIKVIRKPKIIDLKENITLKTLLAEAISTWSKKLPKEIEQELDEKEFVQKLQIIKEAVRDGYSSILEMPNLHVQAIMPRINTLILVSFSTGANFLQQSLRYTVPLIKEEGEKATYSLIPDSLAHKEQKILKHVEKGIDLYSELINDVNVLETRKPEEDARYHLPLCIGTFISAGINMSHLVHMLAFLRKHKEENLPVPNSWSAFVNDLIEMVSYKEFLLDIASQIRLGKYYPNPYPLISNKLMSKIAESIEKNGKNDVRLLDYNLDILNILNKEEIKDIIRRGIKEGEFNEFSDIIFEFAVKESLVARHQIIRHRTIPQQSISIYDAADRMEMLIPNSIRQSKHYDEYLSYLEDSIALYEELKEESEDDAILVLPSNLATISKLRLDGYNIFNFRGFLGNRCCELAQAETQLIASLINNKIKEVFEKKGYKELTYILHANCFKLRKCPELPERAMNCTIFKNKSFEKELFS